MQSGKRFFLKSHFNTAFLLSQKSVFSSILIEWLWKLRVRSRNKAFPAKQKRVTIYSVEKGKTKGLRLTELHKKPITISFSQRKIIEFCVIMETESKTQDYSGCPDTCIKKRILHFSSI